MVPPRCDEKIALLGEYERLTFVYTAAIGEMVPRRLSHGNYLKLCAAAEKARREAVEARDRLHRHVAEHGC
jgi:hypothetical protein